MKKMSYLVMLMLFAVFFAACSDDEPTIEPVPGLPGEVQSLLKGIYVLNSGKMGNNDSRLTYYDITTAQVSGKVFETANGRQLGDTGNSMVIYGKKMYIAVSGSAVVFVTDLKGNLLKEIKVEGGGAAFSPRHFAKVDGKVYVSYMEGYVGAIDTASFAVSTLKVGPMPEGIAYANKKVYVANSDGFNPEYGTTVSVIDPVSFKVIKEIEVAINPQTLHVASANAVYLVSWGNYADVPAKLQKINTVSDDVYTIELDGVNPTNMTIGKDGIAYILSSTYDEDWNQTISYYTFDIVKERILGEFVSSADVPDGYCIAADEVTGDVYIGTSNYISNGDVYIVSQDGMVKGHFDTGALNPIAIVPVR